MKEIVFDPQTHTYTVDGVALPSVTELVAPLGADFDEEDDLTGNAIDAAAERGTVLHAYLAHRLSGGEPEDFELPEEYEDYRQGVELFLIQHTIEPIAIETPIAADTFAGTPDLIADFDGETAILDWKFVSTVAKSRVGAQLNGYLMAANLNGIFPDKLYAVHFKRGDYSIYPVRMDLLGFNACQIVYAYKTRKHPRGAIY